MRAEGGARAYAVRPATAADWPAVADCRRRWSAEHAEVAAEASEASVIDPDFEDRLADWWRRMADRRHTWLAWAGERPIGMAALVVVERMPSPGRPTARWGYVAQVWVDPAYRRAGVATALMGELLAWSRDACLVRLVLNPSEISHPSFPSSPLPGVSA